MSIQQETIQDLKTVIAFQELTIAMHDQTDLKLRNYIQELHKLLLMLQENKDPEAIEKATIKFG